MISRVIMKVGNLYYKLSLRKKNVKIHWTCSIDKNTIFEGNNEIYGHVIVYDSVVGRGSYIGTGSLIRKTKIGRFCSIGPNVRIVAGNHPTHKFVSTYPAFFRDDIFCNFKFDIIEKYEELSYVDRDNMFFVSIGNDVWIGDSVLILNGVRIGNGAIVAAGAVVTKDVEPYTIVAGVPAKKVGQRFNDEQILKMEAIKWWDWSISKLQEKAKKFNDVNEFIENL